MFFLILSKPFDLDQIRMGLIWNNSVSKKNILTKKIFSRPIFSSIDQVDFDNIYHYHENTKQLKI